MPQAHRNSAVPARTSRVKVFHSPGPSKDSQTDMALRAPQAPQPLPRQAFLKKAVMAPAPVATGRAGFVPAVGLPDPSALLESLLATLRCERASDAHWFLSALGRQDPTPCPSMTSQCASSRRDGRIRRQGAAANWGALCTRHPHPSEPDPHPRRSPAKIPRPAECSPRSAYLVSRRCDRTDRSHDSAARSTPSMERALGG